MEGKPRIALLIDADNSPADRIDLILNELSGLGETPIRRAYGNWTKPALKGWAAVLHAQAIRPVQQYDYSKGKNASDMAMVVDAMALLYNDRPDGFAIVSSDADFTPLVMHLREKGASVYGFGQQKTPQPFQSACTRFLFLDQLETPDEQLEAPEEGEVATGEGTVLGEAGITDADLVDPGPATRAATAPQRVPTVSLRQDAGLVTLLRNAVRGAAEDGGWARVSTVGQHISNQSSFDSRNYGYATLTKLLAATELFDMKDEGTSALAVRVKRRTRRG